VQARDAALGREREMLAKSDVNIEYQTEQIAKALENGEETYADSGGGGLYKLNPVVTHTLVFSAWFLHNP
jgi:hypothetical protein